MSYRYNSSGPDRYQTGGMSHPQSAGANSNASRSGLSSTTEPPSVNGPGPHVEANVTTNTSAANSNASKSAPPSFFRRWASDRLASRQKPEEIDPEEGIHGELGLHPLHISSDSLIALVFVHGLKGGSVKTWRKGTDPQCFWPKYWLPRESGFENASIHSFGYDSNWGTTRQSILNVQDFGHALFEELRTNKHLREHSESPIILIGHSMGGLVIKKALISAHRDEKDQALRKRIRSIVFLATPHRGSNLGSVLKNIMAVSRIPKPFLADVASKSLSAQHINDQFTRCTDGLSIMSFYETLPMSVGGLSSVMVVDKASAILGIKGERSSLMNANHRDICKFDNREDPNYIKVRDAMSAEIAVILHDVVLSKREEARSQLAALWGFLGSHPQPDYSYDRAPGTCSWIEKRQDFCDWRDAPHLATAQGPSIYWITASPGTGKTLLATHVISHLQQLKLTCSYYHFQAGKTESQTISGCLRSIAYQMAQSHAAVRQVLIRSQQDNMSLDFDDTRGVWANLYTRGILQVKISSPQYWVIDALDECPKYNELFTLLSNEAPTFPLRIFFTSRKVGDLQRMSQQLGPSLVSVEIPTHNTLEDIETYLKDGLAELPVGSENERMELTGTILSKAGSSFLWARLVVNELQGAWTDQSIKDILERIPVGMVPYYQRAIDKIAQNQRDMPVVKSMLVWTLAVARPLHMDELAHALELDLQKTFPSISTAVEGLCGQLVMIDKNTGLVNLIHPTAREFLLSDSARDFKVDAVSAHERVGLACLKLLQSKELAPPRHQRLIRAERDTPQLPFLGYATEYLSDHLSGARSSAHILLPQLESFFKSHALTWIERMCQQGDLDGLIRSGKNLGDFVDAQQRGSFVMSQRMQVRAVAEWSVTLGRLAVQFGSALLRSPSSIYFIIPPLCPKGTEIYKSFGKSPGGLMVSAGGNEDWEDCLATATTEDEPPSAFACGEANIAVGRRSGSIEVVQYPSLQPELTLKTDLPVQMLHITLDGRHIAVGSHKFLSVWVRNSESEEPLWKARLRSPCLTLASSSTELFAITANGRAWTWDLLTGKVLAEQKLAYKPFNPPPEGDLLLDRAPACASFSPDRQMLALGYSSGPVCLWGFDQKEFIDWATDSNDAPCEHLLFNPNPDSSFLLVGYSGSRLSLFDSWSGELICTRSPDDDTRFESIAWSPNGKLFVTVDVSGCLRVWEGDTLATLYQVQTPPAAFRRLGFTSDGRTIIDIADSDLRVWSPTVLVRKNRDLEASPINGHYRALSGSRITVICAHPTRAVVFAGTNDGKVLVYDAETGQRREAHVDPRRIYITELAISPDRALAVGDVNRDVRVYQLDNKLIAPEDVKPLQILFQFNVDYPGPITQLLFDSSGDYLLVSTVGSDSLYSISKASCVGFIEYPDTGGERRVWKWFNIPKKKEKDGNKANQFGLVADGQLQFYSVENFPTQTGDSFPLDYTVEDRSVEKNINIVTLHEPSGIMVLEICHKLRGSTKSVTLFFQRQVIANTTAPEGESPPPNISWLLLGEANLQSKISHVLGIAYDHIRGDRLVFLDNHSWVSSVPITPTKNKGAPGGETSLKEYKQHFYAPSEYVSYSQKVPPMLMPDGTGPGTTAVVFCRREDVVIVRRGLKFEEVRKFDERDEIAGG
ncbi:NACHT and WD domain protein [Rhypophila decipiens]|uniref:GPI inositol-deacylase n=1 Tax=Rhypophila decipiens TaxID=261697 RepID=A0AAN6Y8M0_9PEZI|nr:NACHT and WD domain protein [Rhypophila decipiens]